MQIEIRSEFNILIVDSANEEIKIVKLVIIMGKKKKKIAHEGTKTH